MNPAATQAVQNNYYGTPVPLQETAAARTVVVLGAGVDAAVGFPTSCSLAPKITEWLETDEGKAASSRIVNSVIRSNRRMTYDKVTRILDGDEKLKKEYADVMTGMQ